MEVSIQERLDRIVENPMPRTKVDAFYHQFPWLRNFVKPEDVKCVFLTGVKSDMLSKFPEVAVEIVEKKVGEPILDGEVIREFKYGRSENIFILDQDGCEFLLQVGRVEILTPGRIIPAVPAKPRQWYKPWITPARPEQVIPEKMETCFEKENIQSALGRLTKMEGKKDKAFYILSFLQSTKGYSIIIYKTPKGYNLLSWLEAENKREQQALSECCDQIDQAGANQT